MTVLAANARDTDIGIARTGMRVEIPIHLTPTACAGAAASYVLRRIAYRAGAYAPGIDDVVFSELHAAEHGRTIDDVQRWFADRSRALDALGYRFEARRYAGSTPQLAAWVAGGRGHRGGVLATSYAVLHSQPSGSDAGEVIAHAVGLTYEDGGDSEEARLVMTDPWSRRPEPKQCFHSALEWAHRERDCATYLVHWRGWS
jgi:hypothetical protein